MSADDKRARRKASKLLTKKAKQEAIMVTLVDISRTIKGLQRKHEALVKRRHEIE